MTDTTKNAPVEGIANLTLQATDEAEPNLSEEEWDESGSDGYMTADHDRVGRSHHEPYVPARQAKISARFIPKLSRQFTLKIEISDCKQRSRLGGYCFLKDTQRR